MKTRYGLEFFPTSQLLRNLLDFIIINDGVKLIVPQIIKSFKNLGLMYEF